MRAVIIARRERPDLLLTELLKMNHYKAPRDKLICILNSCKVIFGRISGIMLNLSDFEDI